MHLRGLRIQILVSVYTVSTSAMAQWEYDPRQLVMLPQYCQYTQLYRNLVPGANNPTEINRWRAIMGGDHNFQHLHHYCWGLEHTNRALYQERTAEDRYRYLRYSIADFDYVIPRVGPDFVLLPEILTKKGENLIRMGKGPAGVLELTRAIELKSDYWPPYAALADYYKSIGDADNVLGWLKKGLRATSNAKPLQSRLREMQADTNGGRSLK